MDDDFWAVRNRVHRKSHEYFSFEYRRWDRAKRNMFYGATDALADGSEAASEYKGAISSDGHSTNLLACYGFLQALYVQQDAVITLSRAVGLNWHPTIDDRLREIREIRNRLTGHPALAGERDRSQRLSSAVIVRESINETGFRGHIYYEDGTQDVGVDVAKFREDNERRLSVQMRLVEQHMDREEREFRAENAARPLALLFGTNFDYLLQRLYCDLSDAGRVGQAQVHAQMIREILEGLRKEMDFRGFLDENDSLRLISTGLELLEGLLAAEVSTQSKQDEYQLLYDGLERAIRSLRARIDAIDAKLQTPVP